MAYSLIPQTVEAVDRSCDPWYTMQVVYPLHHGGSISMFAVGGDSNIRHTLNLINSLYCKMAALDLNLKILNAVYDVD